MIKLEEIATEPGQPERRVFYIDVSELSLSKATKLIDRIRDELKRKGVKMKLKREEMVTRVEKTN